MYSNHGGDYNLVKHNTIYNGNLYLYPSFDGDASGPQHNTFSNNVLLERFNLIPDNTQNHQSTINYNLYPTETAVYHNSNAYSLIQWQSFYSQDVNSLSESPTFIGGTSPSTIAGFELATGSVGENAGSDGKDLGADVTLVGINASAEPDTTPPSHPTGLNVE